MNIKNNGNNGKALTHELKIVSELNLSVIDKLNKLEEKSTTAKLLEEQSKILIEFEKKIISQFIKKMNRERWNKFFRVLQILIYLSTILFFGILVVMILGAAGDLIILDGTIHDLLIGILSSLTGLLSVLFLSILGYLGLKKETDIKES